MEIPSIGKNGRIPKGNKYTIVDGVVNVELSNTKNIMLCDVDTWEKLKVRTWHETKGYAETQIDGKKYRYHYFIKDCPKGYVVDHINRNKLDNRTSNLRVTTPYVNLLNSSPYKNNKCGHKGIKARKYGYIAQIRINKKVIYLGIYKNIDDAIEARKKAEIKYHQPIIEKETLH